MTRSQDQRPRSSKPPTIHGCAQSGDLVGLQRLLRDNPSLLNERNPVVRSPFSLSFIFTIWVSSKSDLFLSSNALVVGAVCFDLL